MAHPNEDRLRDLYAIFAKGDLQGFLDGCTDDVTFHIPGRTPGSGVFTKAAFPEWITGVLGATGGTFQEHVLDVYANDDHGVLLLHHEFDRDNVHRSYETAHACILRDGRIARWEERPGSLAEFEAAWGTEGGDDPAAVVGRIFDEVINQGHLEVADELVHEDYVDHGPMGEMHGRDAFKGLIGQWRSAVPDVHCDVMHVVVDGDLVAWVVRATGTHTGDALGFPATGKSFETFSANMGRIRDGKAAEHWSEEGMLPMLIQLGLFPTAAPTEASR